MAEIVTVDTFLRAETDHYLATLAPAGTGRLVHRRAPTPVEHQDVIRMNRDTLYSIAVVDLDAGDARVTLPDPGGRFQSLQIVDQDHYTPGCVYGPAELVLTRDGVGTRYAALLVRTFADPESPDDVAAAHALQDAVVVDAPTVPLDLPDWDPVTLGIVRDTLLHVAPAVIGDDVALGARGEVDPLRHLVSTAAGWGGNPRHDAMYLVVFPEPSDGATGHRLRVGPVPVDGFWSISVYGPDGYFVPNDAGRYSVNDVTADRDEDGGITVTFGAEGPNSIPVVPGWNYVVRLYRPRAELLDGTWTFPPPEPIV